MSEEDMTDELGLHAMKLELEADFRIRPSHSENTYKKFYDWVQNQENGLSTTFCDKSGEKAFTVNNFLRFDHIEEMGVIRMTYLVSGRTKINVVLRLFSGPNKGRP